MNVGRAKHYAAYLAIIGQAAPWTGPVERRDPATYRQRSTVPRRCGNPACRHWLTVRSVADGWCEVCRATVE